MHAGKTKSHYYGWRGSNIPMSMPLLCIKKCSCLWQPAFLLSAKSSKISCFMIICCIYSSSQTICSHLYSYWCHLLQDPFESDGVLTAEMCASVWALNEKLQHKHLVFYCHLSFVSHDWQIQIISFLGGFVVNQMFASYHFLPPLLSKHVYCRLRQTS